MSDSPEKTPSASMASKIATPLKKPAAGWKRMVLPISFTIIALMA